MPEDTRETGRSPVILRFRDLVINLPAGTVSLAKWSVLLIPPSSWAWRTQPATVDRSSMGSSCAKLSQPRNRILHRFMPVGKTP